MSDKPKYEYLPDLIQKTRLAHIQAEKRLLALDALSRHASLYFACWTSALTLLTLFFDSRSLTLVSVIASAITALCTLYASSQNYAVRAEQMKQSYLALQELWLEFDDCNYKTAEDKAKFADEADSKYIEILARTENHVREDYERSEEETYCRVVFDHIKYYAIRFCIYVLPVIGGLLVISFLA